MERQENLFQIWVLITCLKEKSLMEVFDIGNLVSNIEEANYRKSLHIMLIGKEEGKTLADLAQYKYFLAVVKRCQLVCL